MGTKNKPGKYDCYANAHPDEPMFVLLGRDPDAPKLVKMWAAMREEEHGPSEKIEEARACADAMSEWAKRGTNDVRIIINGREHEVHPATDLTYRKLVDLAGKTGAPTVTWRIRGGNAAGEMTPVLPDVDGASLVPCEGLIVNVAHTDNA